MASIIAIEKDGVVYIGADAVKQRCNVKYYMTKESNFTIHKMKNGIIVGTVGLASVAQQMWLRDELFDLKAGEKFDKRYIVTKIIPQFYEAVKNHSGWKENDEVKEIESGFVFVYKSDIYLMYSDLSVKKCNKIGCMSNEDEDILFYTYASAYMANNPDKSPKEVIKETFKFAASCNRSVNLHGHIINTKDLEFKEMGIIE